LIDWRRERDLFWQIVPKEMLARLAHPLSDAAAAQRA
jgi:glutamate synthase (NADPH/NADH) large chain